MTTPDQACTCGHDVHEHDIHGQCTRCECTEYCPAHIWPDGPDEEDDEGDDAGYILD